jgi:hypothetical protein
MPDSQPNLLAWRDISKAIDEELKQLPSWRKWLGRITFDWLGTPSDIRQLKQWVNAHRATGLWGQVKRWWYGLTSQNDSLDPQEQFKVAKLLVQYNRMSYEKYRNYNSETDPMRFVINPLGVQQLAAFSSLTIKPPIPNRGLINARSTTRLAGWWHGKNVINQANFDTLATARKPFRAADPLDQLHHRTELLQSPYASKFGGLSLVIAAPKS